MDRLRHQSGKRPLRPLAVHRIEAETDPEQRRQEPDEEVEREWDRVGVLGEEQQEKVGGACGIRRHVADGIGHRVDRTNRGKPEHHQENDEPGREHMVGQFLAGHHLPATA